MIDYTLPNEVRWGLYSLEDWSRDSLKHIADGKRELDEAKTKLDDEYPVCSVKECYDDPWICQDHHEVALAEPRPCEECGRTATLCEVCAKEGK